MVSEIFWFQGRSRRLHFGLAALLMLTYALWVGLTNIGKLPSWNWSLGGLPFIWLYLVQGVRRCHDLGKPWWWFLVPFYVFAMLLFEGEQGPNKYGPDPKP